MPITRIEEMPSYTQAFADYQVSLREAGEDEAAQLKVKLSWSDRQRELDREMTQANEHERTVTEAKARIAATYPDVPSHIYESAPDAEKMELVAKSFHEAVEAAKTAAAGGVNPNDGGAAGGQPPVGAGAPSPAGDSENDLTSQIRKLRDEYNAAEGDAFKRKQIAMKLSTLELGGIVQPQLAIMKTGANNE